MEKMLLLVDDEPAVTSAIKRALMDEGYHILSALTGEEALYLFEKHQPQVVISDEHMPGMGGAQFLSTVRRKYPETVRIMLTGHASIEETLQAVNEGEVYRFFTKPWNALDLVMAIRAAFDKFRLEDENRKLLQVIKRQSQELQLLEKRYPGITSIEKDGNGFILLRDSTDDEDIVAELCLRP